MLIDRDISPLLLKSAAQFSTLTLTGPRQSGKTILCRALFPHLPYANLEFPDVRALAESDPRGFLSQFPDGAIIDEVQNIPALLSYLQPSIDQDPRPGKWVLTGSHNVALLQSVQQSLAGRTTVHELLPLTRGEITRFGLAPMDMFESILTGGYPRTFDQSLDPTDWYRSYVSTYLERDVRSIRNIGDLSDFRRFVQLCAGRTAQLLNLSSLASDAGITQPTAKSWFGMLEIAYIAYRLSAYHANIRKRLIKMPKLHFIDTGLVCYLLGIKTVDQLRTHPLRGPLFETWVVSEILKHRTNSGLAQGLGHYRASNGAEADLVIDDPNRLAVIECKSSATLPTNRAGGVRRVSQHLSSVSQHIETAIVYGGDFSSRANDVEVSPWTQLRSLSLGDGSSVTALIDNSPAPGVHISALFPNGTYRSAITDSNGTANLQLHDLGQKMMVFAAGDGIAAAVELDWVPSEYALTMQLALCPGGGSVIFDDRTGRVPGISGRLNPIKDPLGRTYLYTQNVAIHECQSQPAPFELREPIGLQDADGHKAIVRFVAVAGSTWLVGYQPDGVGE